MNAGGGRVGGRAAGRCCLLAGLWGFLGGLVSGRDRSDSRLTFQDWGGKRERKGRGKLEKRWLLLPGAGGCWAATLPKSLGKPLAPNDDGHCPRDRARRVDSSFCVFSLGERRGELSTPPDRMYSLNSLGFWSKCSVPSSCLLWEKVPGAWVLTKAGDRSCLGTVCMTRVVESIR